MSFCSQVNVKVRVQQNIATFCHTMTNDMQLANSHHSQKTLPSTTY